jgi:hypothetical protein
LGLDGWNVRRACGVVVRMTRSLVVALVLGLLFAGVAKAKLDPRFSERIAQPGDKIELDVGEGSEQFLGPLRIFLVSLEGDDRAQIKIGELGTPGRFDARRILRFEVPDVPAGEYTVAIWFKGYETGTWANALEGIHPLLTIGAADERGASPTKSDGQPRSLLGALALTVGGLGAALVGWGWRRAARRATTGVPAS